MELHRNTFSATKRKLENLLLRFGVSAPEATRLLDAWLISGDFLLPPQPGQFDFVIGNPPYVRQELIPAALILEYRKRYATLYDRAGLYIPSSSARSRCWPMAGSAHSTDDFKSTQQTL